MHCLKKGENCDERYKKKKKKNNVCEACVKCLEWNISKTKQVKRNIL